MQKRKREVGVKTVTSICVIVTVIRGGYEMRSGRRRGGGPCSLHVPVPTRFADHSLSRSFFSLWFHPPIVKAVFCVWKVSEITCFWYDIIQNPQSNCFLSLKIKIPSSQPQVHGVPMQFEFLPLKFLALVIWVNKDSHSTSFSYVSTTHE